MRIAYLALVGMVATSVGKSPVTPAPVARDTTISVRTFRFRPDVMEIPAGARVVWTNADDIEHTVTGGIPDSTSGDFQGVLAKPGATFAYRFTRPGTYRYFCDRHRFMRGEIRVTSTGE